MTPPDSNLSLPEVWRSLQRIEQSTAGLGGKIDTLRADMDRRLDEMRSQVVPRHEFADHVIHAERGMKDMRDDLLDRIAKVDLAVAASKKSLGDRLVKLEDGTRLTVWELITRLSPVIATVIVLITALQLRAP